MTSLSRHYDQEQEISQQIRSAVTYPLIMLGMMAVVILVLLVKVLPVFQQVFHQMGLEMNGISQGLLNAGNMISRYSDSCSTSHWLHSFFQSHRKRSCQTSKIGHTSSCFL